MTLPTILALVLAVFVLGATPGPAVFAIVARALASGLRPAIAFNLGVILGDLMLLLLATFGLAAVAQAMGEWFVLVKVAGGLYLIWIGWTMWRAAPDAPGVRKPAEPPAFRRNVVAGLVLTLGNPKAIVFYAAFLPTFVDLPGMTIADLAVICMVIVAVLFTTNLLYGALAARARNLFKSRRAMRNLNRSAGTMMIGAGVAVATR